MGLGLKIFPDDGIERTVYLLDYSKLYLFLPATLVLLLTPGPAVLYIIARSLDQGRMAGFASVIGIEVGNFFHVLAATLGVSAIKLSMAIIPR